MSLERPRLLVTGEPWEWGAVESARNIGSNQISSREYVSSLVARANRVEDAVQAWIRPDFERALEEAARCDADAAAGRWRGPLHGVGVGIKDNIEVAGLSVNAGAPRLYSRIPERSADVVDRLTRAGAIILGKTAMTAFAAMDPASTRNPWNLEHTPGGSSSGSAAAVAARACSLALGTQTAGSILRPASYCGVVGLKPTYDLIPRDGLVPCAWSMDHIGPLGRDVEDCALAWSLLSRRDRSADAGPVIIGIPDRGFETSDDDVEITLKDAVRALEQAGAKVVSVPLPRGFEALAAAGVIVMYSEMAAYHRKLYSERSTEYPPRLLVLVETGLSIPASDYVDAQRVRAAESRELQNVLEGITVLLTPTTAAPAPAGRSMTGDWAFNIPFSASGHPSMTLPCGFARDGLPIGMQAVAGYGQEHQLFRVGAMFQEVTDWHRRCPVLD
jgi:aspartyl-tRNA(Asn)/glutamyl-tRNA(Gln) amidotransferase subunit A